MEAVERTNLRLNGREKEVLCGQLLEVLELSTRFVSSSPLYILIVFGSVACRANDQINVDISSI